MADRCSWADRVVDSADSASDDVLRHLRSCPECQAERMAHEELLTAFRGTARPALSPHFRPQLMGRLEAERRHRKLMRRRFAILRSYWIFAAIVCAAVIGNLAMSSLDALQQVPVLFAAALFALPICVVLIALRINPAELVLHTLRAADNRLPGPQ